MKIGSLVRYRERDWVMMPSDDAQVMQLRPIGGSARETCAVYLPLATQLAYTFPFERIATTEFPLPDSDSAQDHAAVKLLMDAARLLLRDGAAPFRSFGHISVRPRPYQLVPLLMALRLETVRLLIADDVGVGKTIEAGLIARELLDRGDARRLVVLCPPYLCEQWEKELREKFQIEAVVMRSGTVARLERQTPQDRSMFDFFPHLVVSIDLAKSERYRNAFLQHCPDLVIVDEVHGAAEPRGQQRATSQQQRHELLKRVAEQETRHLLLLSATPHSGVEESFRSILGLLKPAFKQFDLERMTEAQRVELARHFIQRRRGDVKRWMGQDTHFPERVNIEEPYTFSRAYREFYNDVYEFARGLIRAAQELTGWKQRMRFWSALALLRCVSSSPAAAEVALRGRTGDDASSVLEEILSREDIDAAMAPVVFDPVEAETVEDAPPANVFDIQEQDANFGESDKRRLREFARRAAALRGEHDTKLAKVIAVLRRLLQEGRNPIVWCRYIATAEYVARALDAQLSAKFRNLRVVAVTGALADDERRLKIQEMTSAPRRVLVATDCLSEGINLQESFDAVIHYDLPWNPNRLEQREGRVDRFGQTTEKIQAVMIFGQDNPVDGAVLDVLLRKARAIYNRLGVYVPVPADSENVMEAVLRSLFSRAQAQTPSSQLALFEMDDGTNAIVKQVMSEWDRAEEREKESRTRFAQHAIRPEQVERELEETDRVLGTPDDVRAFLEEACQRLNVTFTPTRRNVWELNVTQLPPVLQARVNAQPDSWRVMFDSPTPDDVTFVGRNHPLVEALSEYVFDLAFHPPISSRHNGSTAVAARCGVIRTRAVTRRTTLLLLRVRYLVYERGDDETTLAEETLAWGFQGVMPKIDALTMERSRELLTTASPSGNVSDAEKSQVLRETLGSWDALQAPLGAVLEERTGVLRDSYARVRQALKQKQVRIQAQAPADLLGALVLLPQVP